jgi:hypothetical protein
MAVQFVLVTFDEDSNRLQPYLDEMKVPFTVVRTRVVEAEKVLGIDNTPSTFYVDCDGVRSIGDVHLSVVVSQSCPIPSNRSAGWNKLFHQ